MSGTGCDHRIASSWICSAPRSVRTASSNLYTGGRSISPWRIRYSVVGSATGHHRDDPDALPVPKRLVLRDRRPLADEEVGVRREAERADEVEARRLRREVHGPSNGPRVELDVDAHPLGEPGVP